MPPFKHPHSAFPLRLLLCALVALTYTHQPAQAQITLGPPPVIVSAAHYELTPLAPASIAVIFGSNLAAQTLAATTDPLPTTLGGVTVRIRDSAGAEQSAALFFVSPGQINFLTPTQLASGTATVTITNGGITSRGTVEIAPVAPGLFSANANGQGAALGLLARLLLNGSTRFEPLAQFDAAQRSFVPRPLVLGPESVFTLVLYGTGLRFQRSIRAFVGDLETPVEFAGAQPQFYGLDQINLRLPFPAFNRLRNTGRLNVVLSVDGFGTTNLVEIETASVSTPPNARITGFDPPRARAGETVRISGSGLAGIPAVRIGEAEGQIVSASDAALVVRVPFGAQSGPLTLVVGTGAVSSPTPLMIQTSLSGFVEDHKRQPLGGVRVALLGTQISARTNAEGVFLLPEAPTTNTPVLEIDGAGLALTPEFPRLLLGQTVLPSRDNQITRPIVLQHATGASLRVNTPAPINAATISQTAFASVFGGQGLWPHAANNTTNSLSQQTGEIKLELPANASVFPDCNPVTIECTRPVEKLTVTQIENSRVPAILPLGHFSSVLAQITPLQARISPNAKLSFPNADGLPAGARVKLFQMDQRAAGFANPNAGRFIEVSSGFSDGSGQPIPGAIVTADGQRIETSGFGITATGIYFASNARPTATIRGRIFDSRAASGGPLILAFPARRVHVTARGQEALTDGLGHFVLRHVPVIANNDKVTLEISYLRPNGRVERALKTEVALTANQVSEAGDLALLPTTNNRPPAIIAATRLTVDEGATSDFNFLVSDPDPGQTFQLSLAGPSFAALITRGEGRYTLRLTPGFDDAGAHTLTLTARDSQGATAMLRVEITVANVNQRPVAIAQNVTTAEDAPQPITLTASDPDRNALSFTIVAQPAHGRLTGTAPDVVYAPERDYFGADSFTFKVNDGAAESNTATVSLTVTPVNDAPVLSVPDERRVEPGQLLSFVISATDVDAGERLTFTAASSPAGATLTTATAASAQFNWTPNETQAGFFVVTFRVTDSGSPALTTTRAVAVTVGGAGAGEWRATNGPFGGGNVSALFAQGATVYAGTPHGIFVSANNGQDWARAGAGVSEFIPVTAFTAVGSAVFAGTLGGRVYRSGDQGRTWQEASSGLPDITTLLLANVTALTASGTNLFVAIGATIISFPGQPVSRNAVYRSTDNGEHWTQSDNGLPLGTVTGFAVSGANLFAASAPNGVYRSSDNGQSWTAVNNGLPLREPILAAKGSELFAALREVLYRSTDQGASWTPLNHNLLGIKELAVSGNNLYANTGRGVFRSADSGATWTAASNGLPINLSLSSTDLEPLAANATHLFIASRSLGVLRSADQGAAWTPANNGFTNLTVNALAAFSANEARVLAGTDFGAFAADNQGQSWSWANNGLTPDPPFSIQPPPNVAALLSNGAALFGLVGNGVFRSLDFGERWTSISNGLPIFPQAAGSPRALGLNRSHLFASLLVGRTQPVNVVYRSPDQGATWLLANTGLPASAVNCFSAVGTNDENIVAGTAGDGVFLSTNNGASWTTSNTGLPERSNIFALANNGATVFAATLRGVFVSLNGGQNWRAAQDGLPINGLPLAVQVVGAQVFAIVREGIGGTGSCPPGTVLIGGVCTGAVLPGAGIGSFLSSQGGALFVSTKQGESWAPVNAGLLPGRATALTGLGRNVFAGTRGGGVFVRQF